MEIFSYVGGRPDYRQKNCHVFSSNRGRRKVYNGFEAYKNCYNSFSANVSSKIKQFCLSSKIFFSKIIRLMGKYFVYIPVFALIFSTPFFAYKVYSLLESKTNPLVLHNESIDEFDFLNKEMQKFALQSFNEIEEDGSIQGMNVKYTFKEPVTFSKYTVKSGDTISGISKKFNLKNISTIIAVNNIENVRSLNAGKKLIIPSIDGLYYTVRSGDTIESIAKKQSVSVEDLLDVNDIVSENLVIGKRLFIPGAKLDKVTLRNAMGDSFIDPLKNIAWRLTSKCGWRPNPFTGVKQYHPGIDMAIKQGTPIYAAMAGKVVSCGWSNVYGNYVIIDHGNGYQSLYGHMFKKMCKLNQQVTTSTKIGLVGSTGYSTGPHLHFTVYKNGKVVDPLTLIKK